MWTGLEPRLWLCDPSHWKDERVRHDIERPSAEYSIRRHWETFRRPFAQNPSIRRVCVLGVSCRRDITFTRRLLSEASVIIV